MDQTNVKRRSWLKGIARTLDIGNTGNMSQEILNNYDPKEAVIKSDWQAIGDDFRKAINSVRSNG